MVSIRLLTVSQTSDYVGSSDRRLQEIANCPLKGQFAFFCFSFEPLLDIPEWVSGLSWLMTPNDELLVAATAEQWSLTVRTYLNKDADHETCTCLAAVYNALEDRGHAIPGNKISTLDNGFYLQ